MTRPRWTPAVWRLWRALEDRGVVAWRRGSAARLELEDLDGLRPAGMSLLLEALYHEAGNDPTAPLEGWQPRVLLSRDYDGPHLDGQRYGRWLIWRTLWAVGLAKSSPPHRAENVRIVPPVKRPRRRRRKE